MSRAQRDEWRSNDTSFDYGDRAEPPVTKPAESLPAKPAEQAGSTDPTPKVASETANLKTRTAEVEAETARLHEQLRLRKAVKDELDKLTPAAKTDAAPAPSPARPKFDTLEQWLAKNPTAQPDDYIDARVSFLREAEKAADKQQAEFETFSKTIETQVQTYSERIAADVGDVEAFAASLPPILADLTPTWALKPDVAVKPHNIVATEILKSPIPGKVITYLRDHQSEFLAILNAGDAPAITRAMGRLEGKLESGQSTVAPTEPPKLTTSAPPPPKVVSQRPAEPADPKRAAIDSGDYLAFKALEDAEDAARFARRK